MAEIDDPFLAAAVRLGFLKPGEAQKATQEATRAGTRPEDWLLGRGILTPRELERVRRLAGLTRRRTTRSGRAAPAQQSSAAGLAFALLGFVLVLGGGVFFFRDRIFGPAGEGGPEPDRQTAEAATEGDPKPGPTPEVEPKPEPKPEPGPVPTSEAKPESESEPEPEPESGPAPDSEPRPEPRPEPEPKGAAGEGEEDEEVAPAPHRAVRDVKFLDAGDKAFKKGEALNQQVGELEGKKRLDTMEQALEAYTESIRNYRKYAGEMVPSRLEVRWAEVNNRIAMLRKLLPPERAAKFMERLSADNSTAKDLLARAERAQRESPRNYTHNYMLFQRILDEHPGSPEAVRALRRVGEIGWKEITSSASRRSFRQLVGEWKELMAKGNYAGLERALEGVRNDSELREAMQRKEWGWFQTAERALRVPKEAAKNLRAGMTVSLKTRSGATVRGKIAREYPLAVEMVGGKRVPMGALAPTELVRLAFEGKMNGSRKLSIACFYAFCGKVGEAMKLLEAARKRGIPVEDYETPIARLEYEAKRGK